MLQAASRWDLDHTDGLVIINWALVILLSCLGFFFPTDGLIVWFQVVWFVGSLILDWCIQSRTSRAADFKETFDQYVYGWISEIPSYRVRDARDQVGNHLNWVNKQIQNDGSQGGVKDWYQAANGRDSNSQVQDAMLENISYDTGINKIYLVIIIFLGAMFIGMAALSHMTLDDFIVYAFVTFAVPVKTLFVTFQRLVQVQKLNAASRSKLEVPVNDDVLKQVQLLLYKKRQIPGVTPNLVYLWKRNSLNQKYHN